VRSEDVDDSFWDIWGAPRVRLCSIGVRYGFDELVLLLFGFSGGSPESFSSRFEVQSAPLAFPGPNCTSHPSLIPSCIASTASSVLISRGSLVSSLLMTYWICIWPYVCSENERPVLGGDCAGAKENGTGTGTDTDAARSELRTNVEDE
jgi:hypothetical protein